MIQALASGREEQSKGGVRWGPRRCEAPRGSRAPVVLAAWSGKGSGFGIDARGQHGLYGQGGTIHMKGSGVQRSVNRIRQVRLARENSRMTVLPYDARTREQS